MRKYLVTISMTLLLTISAFVIPNIIFNSFPTVNTTKVQTITHTDYITAEGEILKIVGNKSFVKIFVNEKDISKVCIGQPAEITGTAFPNRTYSGVVDNIASCASKQYIGAIEETVVIVNVKITDEDDYIKSGYTADVKILTSEPCSVNIIPYEAVNQDNSGEFVYVLNSGVAVRKDITTGMELGEGIEIKSGLSEDDTLLESDELIKEGKPVKIK